MKTNALIRIIRNDKEIIIYIKEADWNAVPNLDFIEDVEIYPENQKK